MGAGERGGDRGRVSLRLPSVERGPTASQRLTSWEGSPTPIPFPLPCYQCRIGVSCFPACLPGSILLFSQGTEQRLTLRCGRDRGLVPWCPPRLSLGNGLSQIASEGAEDVSFRLRGDGDPPPGLSCSVPLPADPNWQFFLSVAL